MNMSFPHFLIYELILTSYIIFGQISPGKEDIDSEIENIFDLPDTTETFVINSTVYNEKGINTGDVAGICKCLPNELCKTSFLRIKNKEVCKVTSDMFCCSLLNESTSLPMRQPTPDLHTCGQTNSNGIGFKLKVEPSEAKNGEFPWMVSILSEEELSFYTNMKQKFNIYRCGGSLIHPKVVLTSAECVINSTSLMVRAGDWNTQEPDYVYPHQSRKVERVVVHDRFNSTTHANDIALLFLESKFEITENIRTICIKKLNFRQLDMSKCMFNGWGKNTLNGHYSIILKKINLRLMERNHCLSSLKVNNSNAVKLPRSLLCANNNSNGNFCNGDEGSPLVCPIGDTYYQVGIASKHFDCGENNLPSLFVNVSIFNHWIHNRIHRTIGSI